MGDEVVPLTILSAFLWTFAATVALACGLALTGSTQLGALGRPMAVAAWEVLVYTAAVAGVLRVHARAERASAEVGLRRVDARLVLLASLLGLVAQLPVETLRRAAQALAPSPPELQTARAALLAHSSSTEAAAVFVSLAVIAPFAEELFFRGALHGQLRRSQSSVVCGAIVALCFVTGHPETHSWLPLALVAAILSHVRETTGSLWPGYALHATFNAATIATGMSIFTGARDGLLLPWPVLWAGWPVTVGLWYMLYRMAKSRAGRTEPWSEDVR